jgi:hypothetical protein
MPHEFSMTRTADAGVSGPVESWKLPDRVYSRVDIRSLGISEHPEAHIEESSCKHAILRTTARGDLIRLDCFSNELGWGRQCVFMLSFLQVQ